MTRKKRSRSGSWKFQDLWYGVLGFALGFFISFTITNSVQRNTVIGRAGSTATAQQTRNLPPDHPPINSNAPDQPATEAGSLPPGHPPLPDSTTAGASPAMGMPPPLPSLEPRPGPGLKAEQVFKDIQVLKGLPPDEVQQIMGIMTVSLGVKCDYCHVSNSFERPHPKKDITRTMIQMVKKINQEFVGGKVNCYTCHRGSPKPPTQ